MFLDDERATAVENFLNVVGIDSASIVVMAGVKMVSVWLVFLACNLLETKHSRLES